MKRLLKSRLKFLRVNKGYITPTNITHIRDSVDGEGNPSLIVRFVDGNSRELRQDDRVRFIAAIERWHCRSMTQNPVPRNQSLRRVT